MKLFIAALLSASLAMPVTAAPVMPRPLVGAEGLGDTMMVAAKRKKKKQQVRRNPRNGDILLGRVGASGSREGSGTRRGQGSNDTALGALLGAAIVGSILGAASSGRHGGTPFGGGGGNVPLGNNCGVQYWTDTPTSPAC